MNISELAPDELFADLIPRRQSSPADKSVQSQIAPRNTPDMPLPTVRTEAALQPPRPQPVYLFADLLPKQPHTKTVFKSTEPEAVNLFADLIPKQQTQREQKTSVNIFADLIPANQERASPAVIPTPEISGRITALQQEDLDYQKALTAYQTAKQRNEQNILAGIQPVSSIDIGYPARKLPSKLEELSEPVMPGRDFVNLSKDLGSGISLVRPNEFSSVIHAVETGQLPAAEEADLLGKLQPFLNDEGKQVVKKAILTQQKLKAYEEQAGKREAEQNNRQVTNALDWEALRGQYGSSRSQEVMLRATAKPLTLGFAFSPDEDRLHSNDPEIEASERAKQLYYQRESQAYPTAELAGMLVGNIATFMGGTGLYRQGLKALGKSAPATLPAVIKEGMVVEGAITGATRQEGEENKTTPEIIKDRMLSVGINATIGALGDAALFKATDWVKLWKDKRLQKALTNEATAAGYDSPEAYLNNLIEIETTDKGLIVKGKQEPVTNIDYMEQRANETTTGNTVSNNKVATEEISDAIHAPEASGQRGTEDGTKTPTNMVQTGTEPKGTAITEPVVEGRTQSPVTREVIDSRLNHPEYQDYLDSVFNLAAKSDADTHKATRSNTKINDDDTLITAIRKLGGIDRTTMDDTIGDSLRGFIGNIFDLNKTLRAAGKGSSLDDMARKLSEAGYTKNGREMTANELADAIDREITGRPFFSDAMTSYESHFVLEPTALPNNVTRPALEAWLNGETLTSSYRKEIKRLLNEADFDPNFSRTEIDSPDAWRKEFEHADYDPNRYDMVDSHFWQEEETISGLHQANVDTDDLAAIREMERQLQLEDATALEAKYHTIEEPSHLLREQGNVETIRQKVLGNSEEAARIPQENRGADLEGRITGTRSSGTKGQRTAASKIPEERYALEDLNIHLEAPGVGDITIKKNNDGSITANGQKIPKGASYVPNTHMTEPTATGGTLFSNPITFAAKQMARSMNLAEASFSGFGSGAYAGITSSAENEIGSDKWWLDVMAGVSAGIFASATGRYLKAWGKGSYSDQFIKYLGKKWETLPYVGRGDPEIRRLKKKQQLMRQVLDRQTGQMGEFLAKNFTSAERAQMSDMIENRGIPKEGSLVARQAQELDDFITFTSERMKELGMLPSDLETGGYLHRYYNKHLGLDKMFKSAKKLSGSYSIRRGTEETFNPNYLSQSVRDNIREYDAIHQRIIDLEKTSGDLLTTDTIREIEDLKFRRQELEALELKEYIGVQDGKPHSFIFMSDEVPRVPGLDKKNATGLETPQANLQGLEQPALPPRASDMAGQTQPTATDRIWNMRASVGDQPVLWRDWTKAERTSWGEIEDAGYRFVRGQAEVAHDLSMATMFKKISDNPEWVSDTPKNLNGEDWVEVPTSKVHKNSQMKKYGNLSGKYVKPEIWRAIKHYNQPLFGRGKAATLYRNLLNRWKMYKTVYNPVSHFNNAISNTQMYYMAGYSSRGLAESLKELAKGENSKLWREARDAGLFGTDWGSSILSGTEGMSKNLNDLAEKLRIQPDISDADQIIDSVDFVSRFKTWIIETGESVKNSDTKLASGAALAKAISQPTLGVIKKPIKAATDSAQWLYQKEDELFKLAVFIEERNKGLSGYDATEAANRFFFDYNDLPDAVRKIKDFPIGSPFVSYTYLAIPAMIRNAIERPERLLGIAAAFETLNYAGLQLDGELEEQGYWERMDNEKTLNPPWMKGRTAWGAVNTIHVPGLDGYKLSLANAHAMGNPFAGESGKDLPLWPDFMAPWGPDPVGGNPITRIPFDIIFNQDWKGSEIYSKTAPLNEQIRKSLNYAYMNIAPSMPLVPGSWHQQKILQGLSANVGKAEKEGKEPNMFSSSLVSIANSVSAALGGEQLTGADWKGNEYKTSDGVSGSVGVKLRPYRPQDLYIYELNKLRKEMDQVRKGYQLKNKKAARGAYTDKQMKKFEQQFNEDMNSYIEQIEKLENAYRSIK